MTVLIVTDNADGPTQKIARLVADALAEREIEATLGEVADLERAEEFEGIVFGGDVEDGEYSPETVETLTSYASGLSQQLVWLFAASDESSTEAPDLVSNLAARDYRSFDPSVGEEDVKSWASFIADEIDGHS
ncbi:flavodoxin domain-containing protein [Rhodococcus sp. CH91]|uniref:flavodoxin domain-containing protein n=1 Tax=Rhodococcus sp. CH91 TaxID=2910256 RepID=UPI001F4A5B2C|nr:flavodoxin domain-containing protein [Rhodococcus sp. CH91]